MSGGSGAGDHFAALIQRDTAKAPWTPRIAVNIIDHALGNAARRTLVDLGDARIEEDLRAVACATTALFAAAAAPAGTEVVTPHPSGGTVTTTSTERRNVLGQLALAPLAMASVAYDLGLSISVETDYMPSWLMRGGDAAR